MKPFSAFLFLTAAVAGLQGPAAGAQERVWRCGNEYTNDAVTAQQRGCKVMEGGNITVIQGTRNYASSGSSSAAARSPAGSPKVDGSEQKARDGEARLVLESELRKAQDGRRSCSRNTTTASPTSRAARRATTRSTWTAWPSSRRASRAMKAILPASRAN